MYSCMAFVSCMGKNSGVQRVWIGVCPAGDSTEHICFEKVLPGHRVLPDSCKFKDKHEKYLPAMHIKALI